jgi:[ribosomal protein S18]-alanine N-acetyltransferase
MIDSYTIRPMAATDVERIAAIERLCHPSPWSAGIFLKELDNPLSAIDILWLREEPAGYLCSWRILDELHILNVTTAPAFRRQGVARALLEEVLRRGRSTGMKEATLEVRVGNSAAIALYRLFGFRDLYHRPGYYSDGEDALVMGLVEREGEDTSNPAPFQE